MRRLPPLSALPAFEATARLGSVTAAAAELGRTHSAISKQIGHLSADLGGGLFEKMGNGLKLTRRGERLRRSVTGLLDELNAVSETLRAELDERSVDVVVSATLATRWLLARIPRFYAAYPDIEIRLRMTGTTELGEYDFDVLLSYDRLRGPVTHADSRPLGDTSYGPVCAPDYPFAKTGTDWRVPVRLEQPNARQNWNAWARHAGAAVQADRDAEYPHHFLCLEAAVAGLGVALAERRLVEQDLAEGRLIAPLGFVTIEDGFQASVMPRARERRATAAFLSWLAGEVGKA